jgi:transaldolase
MNLLEQLKAFTEVVADTGDFRSIEKFHPVDATTNPSLIYVASRDTKYHHLIEKAVSRAQGAGYTSEERLDQAIDELSVLFGIEILKIIPGRVSTEVSADLSFDTEASIRKARKLISLYEAAGISRDRVLIKLASTWEGIRAAAILEKEGIRCNLTLLFSMPQAIACAEAGVRLISPFVGRIYDWYRKERGVDHIPGREDPGVLSVREIYTYYKKFGYPTQVMGASFRNTEEIIELAGCDLLTISPQLLGELEAAEGTLIRRLDPETAAQAYIHKISLDEKTFRWMLNENAMATEKLAEGIRRFNADLLKLKELISSKIQ